MLRSKGLTDKLLMLGIDGMRPPFHKTYDCRRQHAEHKEIDGIGRLSR